MRDICRSQSIIYQGFSDVRAMAAKYGTGLAQIVFRFSMQIGMLPLKGTTDPQQMKDDLEADRFTLSAEELQRLEMIGQS